ncbi:hypothetical protein PAMP_006348 [Pampus punctatissimus]
MDSIKPLNIIATAVDSSSDIVEKANEVPMSVPLLQGLPLTSCLGDPIGQQPPKKLKQCFNWSHQMRTQTAGGMRAVVDCPNKMGSEHPKSCLQKQR